jgi:hypothetical protein
MGDDFLHPPVGKGTPDKHAGHFRRASQSPPAGHDGKADLDGAVVVGGSEVSTGAHQNRRPA